VQDINTALSDITIGKPTTFLNLTVFPLLADRDDTPPYLTLTEALANKSARITETSADGAVSELRLENNGNDPVLIIDGEELVGAKQNRVTNITILAAAKSTTVIPVSCVEAGRWSYRSQAFDVSQQAHFSRARATKAAAVSGSLRTAGSRYADQEQVWYEISAKADRMKVDSPTESMADMYSANHKRVEDYVKEFRTEKRQAGAMFAIGDRVEGFDLFDCPTTLKKMLPKLIRSFAIDALESVDTDSRVPEPADAESFLDKIRDARAETYPAVGMGMDIRLNGPGVVAGGLVADGKVVHLAAFAAQTRPDSVDEGSSGLAPSRARRYRALRR